MLNPKKYRLSQLLERKELHLSLIQGRGYELNGSSISTTPAHSMSRRLACSAPKPEVRNSMQTVLKEDSYPICGERVPRT